MKVQKDNNLILVNSKKDQRLVDDYVTIELQIKELEKKKKAVASKLLEGVEQYTMGNEQLQVRLIGTSADVLVMVPAQKAVPVVPNTQINEVVLRNVGLTQFLENAEFPMNKLRAFLGDSLKVLFTTELGARRISMKAK